MSISCLLLHRAQVDRFLSFSALAKFSDPQWKMYRVCVSVCKSGHSLYFTRSLARVHVHGLSVAEVRWATAPSACRLAVSIGSLPGIRALLLPWRLVMMLEQGGYFQATTRHYVEQAKLVACWLVAYWRGRPIHFVMLTSPTGSSTFPLHLTHHQSHHIFQALRLGVIPVW